MKKNLRSGSALLIVLGLLAFMVVSAVAFSTFMRTSRLPSSYLLRGTTSRYLLRAALAGAISRIDGEWRSRADAGFALNDEDVNATVSGFLEGVWDDPYPGLGHVASPGSGLGQQSEETYRSLGNRWVDRVFSPFADVSPEETVSTLTTEGLAYLPPAVINEARLQTRRTRTAMWSNLTYEAGRYAFSVIDVSDCFDVNRLRARARTSAANSRVGFASTFRTGDAWASYDAENCSAFNTKADAACADSPFVSLADFNLFFGAGSFSPFCNHIGQSGGYGIVEEGDTIAANAFYITDTWFPPTNDVEEVIHYYLEAGDQPFTEFDPQWGVEDVLREGNNSDFGKLLRGRLGGIGFVALYDYLDADNIPVSFALPTVETAPMVCGLGINAPNGLRPQLAAGGQKGPVYLKVDEKTRLSYRAVPYEFSWDESQFLVHGLVTFPFKRVPEKNAYATRFTADGLVKVFLAPSDLNAHLDPGSPLCAGGTWNDASSAGVVTRKVTVSSPISFVKGLPKQEEAVKGFESDPVELPGDKTVLFYEITETEEKMDEEGNWAASGAEPRTFCSLDGVKEAAGDNVLYTYDRTGKKEDWLDTKLAAARQKLFGGAANGGTITEKPTEAAGAGANLKDGDYVAHVVVWMKLSNAENKDFSPNGRVVDVVPAYAPDDKVWGQHNSSENDEVLTACGDGHPPILRFSGLTKFPYGVKTAEKLAASDGQLDWKVLYVADPRFNFAPEAWFAKRNVEPKTVMQKDQSGAWLTEIQGLLGTYDSDIFMFTSDQEYLQSMGELQFLPRTRDLTVAPGQIMENFANWNNWSYQFDGTASSVLNFMPGMWETYSAIDGDPVWNVGDPGVVIASAKNDFRVNPFTSNDDIFLTVIANTPYDYFVASSNEQCNALGKAVGQTAATDMRQYSFGPNATSAKLSDEKMEDIGLTLHDRFLNAARNWGGDVASWPRWERLFDSAAWYDGQRGDDQKSLFGVELDDPLHSVDRKFLHSFWRECFQNRQQLFLVFLRAEPLSVGGCGKASLASAQLGARGVALVWRDPEPPLYQRDQRGTRESYSSFESWMNASNGNPPAPHRTRVLFYHQFE